MHVLLTSFHAHAIGQESMSYPYQIRSLPATVHIVTPALLWCELLLFQGQCIDRIDLPYSLRNETMCGGRWPKLCQHVLITDQHLPDVRLHT